MASGTWVVRMTKTHPSLPPLTVEDFDDARRVVGMLLGVLPEIGVLVVDTDMRVRLMAGDVHMLRGTSEEAVIGRRVDEVVLPGAWDALEGEWATALGGETAGLDWASLDGVSEDWLHFAPLRNPEGAVIGATMITQDISERWVAHRQLERQVAQQAAIVELGSLALRGVPADQLTQEAARIAETALGADKAAVLPYLEAGGLAVRGISGDIDLPLPDAAAPGGHDLVMDHMRDAEHPLLVADLRVSALRAPMLEAAGMVSMAVAAIGPPGSRYGLLGACSRTAAAFSTADLAFVQSLANVLAEAVERERSTDEARRREDRLNEAQRDLQLSEERFRQGFDGAPIGMTLVDPASGRFLRVNEAYCKLVGRSAAELLTMSFGDVLHPEDVTQPDADEFESGRAEALMTERRYVRGDGSTAWGAVNVSRVLGPDGEVDVLFAQILDVTKRRAEEETTRRELAEIAWVQEINAALTEDRFELYAQPIVDMATGEVVQRELLLRMHSTTG
ncbi:MAG: multi-sensor signal transduction histidine kinase, partial [Solirubrobacteraceae bacterium]|nr:multi-sensor signal transduction histidine kinase [Solirubrobacteraceae bacterium]